MDPILCELACLRRNQLYRGGELCITWIQKHPGTTFADVAILLRQIGSCLHVFAEKLTEPLPPGIKCANPSNFSESMPFRAFWSTRVMPWPLVEMLELGTQTFEENLEKLKYTGIILINNVKDMAGVKHGVLKVRTKEVFATLEKEREHIKDKSELARLVLKEESLDRGTVEEVKEEVKEEEKEEVKEEVKEEEKEEVKEEEKEEEQLARDIERVL